MNEKYPDFFIIGAGRSGTTSLCRYLDAHPQVHFSPVKEPNYFFHLSRKEGAKRKVSEEKWKEIKEYGKLRYDIYIEEDYERLFDGAKGDAVTGEGSVCYLYYPGVADEIHKKIPNAKIIVMLRDPVDRAFSAYSILVAGNREKGSFERGLAKEKRRIAEDSDWIFHYKKAGFYFEQLKRYYNVFGKENILVILYEDFVNGKDAQLNKICGFLGIDEIYDKAVSRTAEAYNKSAFKKRRYPFLTPLLYECRRRWAIPRRILRTVLPEKCMNTLYAMQKIEDEIVLKISERTRRKLIKQYKDDILKLQGLIERDLAHWME